MFVLRAFDKGATGDDVPGPSDPVEHLTTVELELALADLETVETQHTKRARAMKLDKTLAAGVDALAAAQAILAEGTPLYRAALSADMRAELKPYFLLTNKPVICVVNVADTDLERADELAAPIEGLMAGHTEVLAMCVQLEAEAATLPESERQEMLDGFGLGEGALPRLCVLRTICWVAARSSPRARRKHARGPFGPEHAHPSVLVRSTPTSNAGSFGLKPSSGICCWSAARGTRRRSAV